MLLEKKIKYRRGKRLKHQTIWNFMRRNPVFRVSEILMVCEVSKAYFSKYINTLEQAKYIKFVGKKKRPYMNREYRLINNTGATAPKLIDVGLYDANIKKEIVLTESKRTEIPSVLEKILFTIKKLEIFTIKELSLSAGITIAQFRHSFEDMNKLGLIIDCIKERETTYISSSKRANEILKELKKGKSLESLCIKQ